MCEIFLALPRSASSGRQCSQWFLQFISLQTNRRPIRFMAQRIRMHANALRFFGARGFPCLPVVGCSGTPACPNAGTRMYRKTVAPPRVEDEHI